MYVQLSAWTGADRPCFWAFQSRCPGRMGGGWVPHHRLCHSRDVETDRVGEALMSILVQEQHGIQNIQTREESVPARSAWKGTRSAGAWCCGRAFPYCWWVRKEASRIFFRQWKKFRSLSVPCQPSFRTAQHQEPTSRQIGHSFLLPESCKD